MEFIVEEKKLNIEENPTVLIAGYTGSGKSVLLKNIWKQLSSQNVKFLFLDLKKIEWADVKDKNQILPVILEVDKVTSALDFLFSKNYNEPVVVLWDTFDDYVFYSEENFENFKKLLAEGPSKKIFTFAVTSRGDAFAGLEDLFSLKIIGSWNMESLDFLNDKEREKFKDIENLPTGKFILTP